MIITLVKANFSANNIGTLNSFIVFTDLGTGLIYSGPTVVDKGTSYNTVITIADGYEIDATGVVVTMGGMPLSNSSYSISDTAITINIAEVVGNIVIKVPTTKAVVDGDEPEIPDVPEDVINAGLTLHQGYVDNKTLNNVLATRVRTDALQGPCMIEVNEGYLIRAIYEYAGTAVESGGNLLVAADKKATTYTYQGTRYIYATFCKTDATQNLLPTEDIVKVFSTDVDVNVPDVGGKVEVNGITLDLGQLLDSGLKANATRAYTVNNVNDKTTFTTTGNFVMIPIYDNDDIVGNGLTTFYTSADGVFNTSKQGSLQYHSTINIADLQTAAPDKFYRIMFKRNDGAAINLADLQAALTIV